MSRQWWFHNLSTGSLSSRWEASSRLVSFFDNFILKTQDYRCNRSGLCRWLWNGQLFWLSRKILDDPILQRERLLISLYMPFIQLISQQFGLIKGLTWMWNNRIFNFNSLYIASLVCFLLLFICKVRLIVCRSHLFNFYRNQINRDDTEWT